MIPKWKIDNTENITFFKKNIQVDYFKNDLYKNIIYSKQQIIPSNEEKYENSKKILSHFYLY
jgi:hypothetical protein